jgi:hypothetical protein
MKICNHVILIFALLRPFLGSLIAAEDIQFSRDVLPVLSNKCFVCHGPDAKKNELRLDSYSAAIADRGGYSAIDPVKLVNSEILNRLHDAEDPMPPLDAEKQLTDVERTLLDQWVLSGGDYAKHWAFVKPVKDGENTNIDQLVTAKLRSRKLALAPQANRSTLARRVALTLTGLPPDPETLQAFSQNDKEDAYESYVDALLENSRYGEHQARYWLDAVRYGDTHGLHLDNRRGIYPYRDWVVRALNENMPMDQFITWQLAGDLVPEPSIASQVATGYVRMNPTTSEGGVLPEEFQAKNNFDRTENLGTVFLGMSLNCVRCHTHKYDPIKHTEYYELMAFFNSTAEKSLDGNKYEYGPVIKAPKDQADWDALAKIGEDQIEQRVELEKTFTTSLVAKELDKPRATRLLERGEYNMAVGEPLQPDVLDILGDLPAGAPRNRLGLAQWLTHREHPLTARVLINRVWQRTFGRGLVSTAEDFGLQGEQPSHPVLLDWLAVELQESGWDLKHMLKLMVTSKAFRQSSAWRNDIDDPDNVWLARGPSYRLDAEVLRDLGLWSSGLLDPTMGGEGVKPYQPSGIWKAMAHPASNTKEYVRDKGDLLYRRSLYVYWKRTSPHPMMTLFDAPDRETSCVRRARTNTSLQSLGMLNETQRIEMARTLAERLLLQRDNDEQRLDLLFTLLASRPPNDSERRVCSELLAAMQKRYAEAKDEALGLLATGDAALDESLNPIDVAAWAQVAVTLLASDLAILNY